MVFRILSPCSFCLLVLPVFVLPGFCLSFVFIFCSLSSRNFFEPTSACLFSGTSFWVNAKSCQNLHGLIADEAENWLKDDKWDNEQIMMRNALPISDLKILYLPQRKETGTVARHFDSISSRKQRFFSNLIERNLL